MNVENDFLLDINTILEIERPRLVQFCLYLTKKKEAAEDLAQETLLEAWRLRQRLHTPEGFSVWLTTIARNICLRWLRAQGYDQAYIMQKIAGNTDENDSNTITDGIADDFNVELELERKELIELLDQALALLPPETRAILIERYVQDRPVQDLAKQHGLQPNTIAKRLERSRLAFQHILTTQFQHELAPYCLSSNKSSWQQTYLWCPLCGKERLRARSSPDLLLEMKCPGCAPRINGSLMDFHDERMPMIKGYGRLLEKSMHWMNHEVLPRLHEGYLPCPDCGRLMLFQFGKEHEVPFPYVRSGFYDYMFSSCLCGYTTHTTREGMSLTLLESRRFWKEYSRIHLLSVQEIDELEGIPAVVTTFASVDDRHRLHVITARKNFQVLKVYQS